MGMHFPALINSRTAAEVSHLAGRQHGAINERTTRHPALAGREAVRKVEADRPADERHTSRSGECGLVVRVQLRRLQPDPDSEAAGAEQHEEQRSRPSIAADGGRAEAKTTILSLSVRFSERSPRCASDIFNKLLASSADDAQKGGNITCLPFPRRPFSHTTSRSALGGSAWRLGFERLLAPYADLDLLGLGFSLFG